MSKTAFAQVPIAQLHVGPNVRVEITDLGDLVASIKDVGILQPIVGCPAPDGNGAIEVLMGQRRLSAARLAGLDLVPVVLRPRPSERDRLVMQLAENLERADMTPIEEARALDALVAQGLTQEQAGRAVNRSGFWVTTRLQLLRMPRPLQDALHARNVTPTVALSIPRSLFADKDAVKRLRAACVNNEALRRWAHAETIRLAGSSKLEAGYRLERPVSLPVEYVELANEAARIAGKPARAWIRDAIETAAKKQGVVLPEHIRKIARVERPARASA